jgi:hypothetical protein
MMNPTDEVFMLGLIYAALQRAESDAFPVGVEDGRIVVRSPMTGDRWALRLERTPERPFPPPRPGSAKSE